MLCLLTVPRVVLKWACTFQPSASGDCLLSRDLPDIQGEEWANRFLAHWRIKLVPKIGLGQYQQRLDLLIAGQQVNTGLRSAANLRADEKRR